MGSVVLITGGAKSGKSLFAERLVGGLGRRVAYIATLEIFDSEMRTRVARHRSRRPEAWATYEAPLHLLRTLLTLPGDLDAVLVDCLTLWSSNALLALGDPDAPDWWDQVEGLQERLLDELRDLIAHAGTMPWHLVLVTNEVGCGVVPPTPLGRAFRDLLGAATQFVAAHADAVFLVVAGQAVDLKRLAVDPQTVARSLMQFSQKGSR